MTEGTAAVRGASGTTVPIRTAVRGGAVFAAAWSAQLLARIGNGLTPFALTIHFYRETGLSSAVALITLAGFLPAVLLTPYAGLLADRMNRLVLMALANLGTALGLGLLTAVLMHRPDSLWLIGTCLVTGSASSALLDPAYRAIVTDLLPPAHYGRAAGFVQFASASQFLVSPALAAALLARADIIAVVCVDLLLSLTATLIMMGAVRAARRTDAADRLPSRAATSVAARPPGLWRELTEGITLLRTERGLRALLWTATCGTFCLGILQTLLTPLVLDLAGDGVLGAVRSIAAVGMVAASLAIGVLGAGRRPLALMRWSFALAGVAVIGIGLLPSVTAIGVCAFAFFVTLAPLNTVVEVLARATVPVRAQGRIWGLMGFVSQFGYVLAYGVSGVLADQVFAPLLLPDGPLAESLGPFVGVGPSRGVGLLIGIVGLLLLIIAALLGRAASLRDLATTLDRAVREGSVASAKSGGGP
ncbi:MFS transporter [Brevibacterium album]|uniref:MFS transporter n=1 Tax=Brevibacterium album TaxID=417948 RepID=UPI0004063A93|nr:MFS transporter [Brevibacterium album]